jgi:hypothetical protein
VFAPFVDAAKNRFAIVGVAAIEGANRNAEKKFPDRREFFADSPLSARDFQ